MNAWSHRATLLGLAPLLMMQGLYARSRTPKLPEASGERVVRTRLDPLLRLLIAGDSATAGVGVASHDQALCGQFKKRLATSFDLHWHVIAQTGYTTRDLLNRLDDEPRFQCDTAVLSLGANDVTSGVRLSTWLEHQRKIASVLQHRHGATQVILSSVAKLSLLPSIKHLDLLPLMVSIPDGRPTKGGVRTPHNGSTLQTAVTHATASCVTCARPLWQTIRRFHRGSEQPVQ